MGQTAQSPFASLDPTRQKLAVDMAKQKIQEVRETAAQKLHSLQAEMARRKQEIALEDVPPAFKPFLQPSRYKGAHGGRGSAKSWTFARLVLRMCMRRPGLRVACIREIQKSLEQSVKRLLEDQIELLGLGAKFKVLNTHIETPGGGIIIFQGMQNHTADSIKSLEGYDLAWVEEAQSLSERSLTLLRPTIRKEDSEIWFTWNPRKKTDPVDVMLRTGTPPPGSIIVEVTYRDNPFFGGTLQKEMEWDRSRDVEKYNHVWLGQYELKSEARVFRNYIVEDFDTPADAAFLFGGDWGFATDPDVLLRMYIIGQDLWIDQEVYKIGCEIDDTPALFDSLACGQQHVHDVDLVRSARQLDRKGIPIPTCDAMARQWQIITDSARPETISYMQNHGYPRVLAAKKGAGSIEEGIKFLKNYNIHIHTRCRHTSDEFGTYAFKTDPLTGQIIPVLEDKKNHVIDSARYGVENVRNPQATFVTW